ncbi:3'-5' exoribonuclease domain-containing protein [Nostoc sp. FACHB-280]|uniref:3'-5' exoribonuclease domain-containing protein n=1 Tax=Nostoc sp. FACHB-280 TaxID=2692839 RepID=UPI00168BE2A0|nr:3'-5' exoribonuclease [Nostoc sp. FACHB-280]MBD2494434.1 3'-5' exoribonuclease [Nostoc sp. FACHB-280]
MTIEIYVSTDIEADGPIPGPHSMLSIGSAAYTADKQLIATFSANLETLPGAAGHPKTMKWWSKQPEAWEACRINPQPPASVMQAYYTWLKALPGKPIFVAYPAAYDFMFVYWYLLKFVGESPFKHSALDIRSYAMAFLQKNYTDSGKENFPSEWLEESPLSHIALEDAIQQGKLFCNLLQNNLQRKH